MPALAEAYSTINVPASFRLSRSGRAIQTEGSAAGKLARAAVFTEYNARPTALGLTLDPWPEKRPTSVHPRNVAILHHLGKLQNIPQTPIGIYTSHMSLPVATMPESVQILLDRLGRSGRIDNEKLSLIFMGDPRVGLKINWALCMIGQHGDKQAGILYLGEMDQNLAVMGSTPFTKKTIELLLPLSGRIAQNATGIHINISWPQELQRNLKSFPCLAEGITAGIHPYRETINSQTWINLPLSLFSEMPEHILYNRRITVSIPRLSQQGVFQVNRINVTVGVNIFNPSEGAIALRLT